MITIDEALDNLAARLTPDRHGCMTKLYIYGGTNPYTQEKAIGLKTMLAKILKVELVPADVARFQELAHEYCQSGRGLFGSRSQESILNDILTEFSQKKQTNVESFLSRLGSMFSPAKKFRLKDPYGDNFATGISYEASKDRYVVNGLNASQQSRLLYLYDDGRVRGYNDNVELGVVGKQLYDNREAIFDFFKITLPEVHRPRNSMTAQFCEYSPG